MAALNFVAAEDGLEDDPKLRGLAKTLRVPRPMAFWFVMRWRRLILARGNHLSGFLPKNYAKHDIAAYLEFSGDAERLVDAMKSQGFMACKKGRGYFYPEWRDTITGRYAHRRELDRLAHDQKRQATRAAPGRQSDDVGRRSVDTPADGRTTSSEDQRGSNEGNGAGRPPDPPPAGGDSVAGARWQWLLDNAPTCQNSRGCTEILRGMAPADWELVMAAYRHLETGAPSISKKNRRVLEWPTDQFLRKQAYLRFRPKQRPTRKAAMVQTAEAVDVDKVEKRVRQEAADTFLRQLLSDPDQPASHKEAAKERWLAEPTNLNRAPPWRELTPHHNGVVSRQTETPPEVQRGATT